MSKEHNKLPVCPNCGTALSHEANFCPNCGQENHEVKLPLGHIFYEFVESITHFDNKLWNSLKAIFTRPGKMTAEFLEGKRARYVPPARLYVFVSVIFFFLIGRFADHQLEETLHTLKERSADTTNHASTTTDFKNLIGNDSLLRSRKLYKLANRIDLNTELNETGLATTVRRLKRFKPAELDSLLLAADLDVSDSTRAELREVIALVPDKPKVAENVEALIGNGRFKTQEERERYEERLSHFSDAQVDSLIRADGNTPGWFMRKFYRQQGKYTQLSKGENTHEFLHVITKNLSVVMFVLMPFVAVLLLFFYFRRGRYYYEHLIFSVHIHTVLFLLFSLALLTAYFTSSELTLSVLNWAFWISWLYFLLALKRVYGQSWGKTVLKFFLLSVMYAITGGLFLGGAITAGLLTF